MKKFNEQMREISGFGGGYEAICRQMVEAGVKWLDENGNPEISFKESEQIFGLSIPSNEAMETLEKVMTDAGGEGLTGAMIHACTRHIFYIRKNGWDKYVEEMSKPSED